MKLEKIIEQLEETIATKEEAIKEHDETYGEEIDASDVSGGNFDDAYSLGIEHGELFAEYNFAKSILKELKSINKDEKVLYQVTMYKGAPSLGEPYSLHKSAVLEFNEEKTDLEVETAFLEKMETYPRRKMIKVNRIKATL